jgi:integrase
MGLGSLHTVSLAEARRKAKEAREALDAGKDPIADRDAKRAAERAARAKSVTFRQATEAYIASHAAGWRNEKHSDQWRNTLAAYAFPVIGDLPVGEVDTNLVLKILEPIWESKTETATRVRGRIEAILDAAKVRGQRAGENPARWRGHLRDLLPERSKVKAVTHHAALPFGKLGAFMADLRGQDGMAAKALTFVILTACRTSEAIGATWDEIDLEGATWTIPADRIKAGREHRVPLSRAAVALLRPLAKAKDGSGFVFMGGKHKRGLSNGAMLALLRRMGRDDLTAHGFRSTFRDWAAEQTNFPREVAEAALAHVVSDKTEAAYRRGDLFEKRRRLMEAWATFACTITPKGEVVKLSNARKRK